jgi:hypothetical protein
MDVYKFLALALSVTVLQACGGGGGGGASATLPPANKTVEVIEDGTNEKPFLQTTLSALNASDPNAVVQTGSTNTSSGVNTGVSNSSVIYDLRWGTPDTLGPGYASQYSNGSGNWQPSSPIYFWGQRLTNPLCSFDVCTGPEISRPLEEVIDAWNKGWTGKDVNVLIEDELTGQHGVITGLLAYRYAPGANYYGFNIVGNSFATQVFFNQLDSPQSGAYGSNIKLGVVNQSYTANMSTLIQSARPWTTTQLEQARTAYAASSISTINRMKDAGVTGQLTQFKFSDAVITKAAGNDSILAEYEPLNWFLAKDSNINSRLLIVGALNQAGSVDSTSTTLATYSNTAGNDADVSSRFLVASGTTPFYSGQVAIGGRSVSQGDGTSYAAPRVAGYVAIVRSKFPNLNASNTASILLDTARYDTLTCYKTPAGCDIKIYGKGEASLTRALAPVGRLR